MEKLAFSMLSKYSALYENKYNKKPVVNKYKEKWGMKSLIEDFGEDEVYETLNYYINKSSKEGHPLSWFYNNFDVLYNAKRATEKDLSERLERRKKMQEIRQEYINGIS